MKEFMNDREKALKALKKAKELNRPVVYLTAKDSEFMRKINLKKQDKKDPPKSKEERLFYTKEQVLSFKYTIMGKAYDSGMTKEEACNLIDASIYRFKPYYKAYLKAKEKYNL